MSPEPHPTQKKSEVVEKLDDFLFWFFFDCRKCANFRWLHFRQIESGENARDKHLNCQRNATKYRSQQREDDDGQRWSLHLPQEHVPCCRLNSL